MHVKSISSNTSRVVIRLIKSPPLYYTRVKMKLMPFENFQCIV